MPPKTTQAVVINTLDHGESDSIITFYTPTLGKLAGIARGAKRSKKRFVNKLEMFSLLDIQYEESNKSTLVRIDQAELLDSFQKIRENYGLYVGASLICELLLHWTRENDSDIELFNLLVWALKSLNSNKSDTAHKTAIFFQSRLLTILGYQPHLSCCIVCGSMLTSKGSYKFSASKSGIICSNCINDKLPTQMPISLNTAKLLQKSMELPKEKLDRLHFSALSTREAIHLLQRYGHFILQKDIHSWQHLSHCGC
jgi:DNA repair protein RecO (recombination protein O)